MARVNGSLMVTVVPVLFSVAISMEPPSASIAFLATSIPTPRPDTLETTFAVEDPGSRMKLNISLSVNSAWGGARPFSTAFASMASLSKPFPSSLILMSTFAPE